MLQKLCPQQNIQAILVFCHFFSSKYSQYKKRQKMSMAKEHKYQNIFPSNQEIPIRITQIYGEGIYLQVVMGVYLSQPVTEKQIKEGTGKGFSFCMAEMQGWRKSMEDASIYEVELGDGNSLFAVFDGHGGHQVSKFVEAKFIDLLMNLNSYKSGNYKEALVDAFKQMDEQIVSQPGRKELNEKRGSGDGEHVSSHTGCTANVVLMTPKKYIIANAGDSRSVLCRSGKAIALSQDHKPESEEQEKRIKKAGGAITMGRVNGGLNLTRSFGDFDYKQNHTLGWHEQMITANPDVKQVDRDLANDEFIIIGCDGIWQKYVDNSQGLIDIIKQKISKGKQNKAVMEQLLNELLAKDTMSGLGCDNMTSIIVRFGKNK